MDAKKSVLSGMRPSGKLHLGNYLGALRNWERLQNDYRCFYFVADWHALTSDYADTSEIKQNVLEMGIDWLACGLDPEKSTLFIQSRVPEHAELHLLLSMITPLPWLERVPSYKEQRQEIKDKDLETYGFLGYPLLQAADIIIYKADFVPVGIDQAPHVEMTREIARRFNSLYKTAVFPEPAVLLTEIPKLMGTDGRKMSKSYNNSIYLSDSPSVVAGKLKTMVTDPRRVRRTDPGNPEVCPVFSLHQVFSSEGDRAEVEAGCRSAAIGCIGCKEILTRNLNAQMGPIYERRSRLAQNPGQIVEVLENGSARARLAAAGTLAEVREAMKIA